MVMHAGRDPYSQGRPNVNKPTVNPKSRFTRWREKRSAKRAERRKTPIEGAVKSADSRKKAFGKAFGAESAADKSQAEYNRKIIRPPDYTKG